MKDKENLPLNKITGIVNDRPFLPITLYSAMELSTLVQGSGTVQEEDVKHLPSYIRRLNKQVFEKKPSKPSGMPAADTKVSNVNKTLNKDKLSRIASVILTANNIDSRMVKSFKRKYK